MVGLFCGIVSAVGAASESAEPYRMFFACVSNLLSIFFFKSFMSFLYMVGNLRFLSILLYKSWLILADLSKESFAASSLVFRSIVTICSLFQCDYKGLSSASLTLTDGPGLVVCGASDTAFWES